MFNIVDYPPQHGECSFCKKHDCGTKEDGTQMWLHSPIELHLSGDLIIGYRCVKSMSDNMGITVQVIEREVLLTPTVEQIGDYVRNAVIPQIDRSSPLLNRENYHPNDMERDDLKMWLKNRNIPFVPQWGEERLREEALKHV